jgi:hypothetical protein
MREDFLESLDNDDMGANQFAGFGARRHQRSDGMRCTLSLTSSKLLIRACQDGRKLVERIDGIAQW